MKKLLTVWSLISSIGLITLSASEKLKIYGFMDYDVTPIISLNNNSPLRAFIREDIIFGVDNLNVYLDFNPNSFSRAMIETQFLVNNLATQLNDGTSAFAIERAWIEGIFSDQLKIRGGRFITPAGIWNVDHGSPIITTIAAPVQTTWFPIFPESQLGMMAHGTYFAGDHDLQYNLYNSTGSNVNNQIRTIQDIAWGGHLEMKMDKLQQLDYGISAMTGMIREDYLSVTQNQIPGASSIESQDQWFFNDDTTNFREVMYGAQFKAKQANIGFQSELNFRHVYNILNQWKRTDFLAGYGLLSYEKRLSENLTLTPYVYVEYLEWRRAKNNPVLAQQDLPFNSWFNNIAGLNLGIFSNMHLKGEFTWAKLNPVPTSLFQGTVVHNQYKSGDLDIYTLKFQFSMAF